MKIRISLAQISTKLGLIEKNLEKHLALIEQAKQEKADLIVFPELSLTGYVLLDMASKVAISPKADDPIFGPLFKASQDIDIIVGFVEEDKRNRIYISAAYLSKGRLLHIHRKVYLPTYGLFDEGRFFARGNKIRAFDTRFGRFGMLICEDFWHAAAPYLLWLDGADILVFMSASPGRGINNPDKMESTRWVDHIIRGYASMFTSFVVYTNRVGFEDGIHFTGNATIYDPNGTKVGCGPEHEEALTTLQIDLNQLHRTRTQLPLLRDENVALVNRELNRILNSPDEDLYI